MVPDDRGLADDDAGAVVDEEILADGGPGVDIDARLAVGVLGHDSRQQGHPHGIEHMGQAINRNGENAGVAIDDLIGAVGGGVSVVEGLHIRLDHVPQRRNGPEEIQAHLLGLLLGLLLLHVRPEDHGQLLDHVVHHVLNEHGQIVMGIVNAVIFVPAEARIDNAHELADHIDDHLFVRMGKGVHAVNAAAIAIVLQNGIHNAFHLLLHGCHGHTSSDSSLRISLLPGECPRPAPSACRSGPHSPAPHSECPPPGWFPGR